MSTYDHIHTLLIILGNRKSSACNLYIEQLDKAGVSVLGICVCRQPVGKHLHEPSTKIVGKIHILSESILTISNYCYNQSRSAGTSLWVFASISSFLSAINIDLPISHQY